MAVDSIALTAQAFPVVGITGSFKANKVVTLNGSKSDLRGVVARH